MAGSASPEDLLLDEQLCFALYAASRAMTDLYRPMLTELGLTYPQYLVLLVLWERDPRPVKEIADALRLDYGTVSPLLKRLEARGVVRRTRARDDERSVRVELTDEGAALRDRAECVPARIGAAAGIGDEDRHALIRTLRDLTDVMAAADPEH